MDWLRHDLREAARRLVRRPGFSTLVIGTLALGLSLNTVAFTFVDALLIRPTHRPDSAATGWLFIRTQAAADGRASVDLLTTLRHESRTLAAVAGETRLQLTSDVNGALRSVWGLAVSQDYFAVVTPPLAGGRIFSTADTSGNVVPVLVSERFWNRQLQHESHLSAIRITLNHRSAVVVGVVRDDFHGPGGLFEPDLWLPLDSAMPLTANDRAQPSLALIARPAPGAGATLINEEVRAIAVNTQPRTLPPSKTHAWTTSHSQQATLKHAASSVQRR